MLENNNLKVCRKLVRREFKFHKGRNLILMIAISLVCGLCTFSFSLGGLIQDAFVYNFMLNYGSTNHILYYGMTTHQADQLAKHSDVKKSVRLSSIGLLCDDVMEYRSVKLAAATPEYGQTIEAIPTTGTMPQADDEIALDKLTLDSLAIEPVLGTEITIKWKPSDGSPVRTDTFRLCGYWESAMSSTETCAWITPEKARMLCPNAPDQVTLGVTLYQPDRLEDQAAVILKDLGLGDISFTTNLAYNDARLETANDQAAPYYLVNTFVILCGILMIYNIMRISTEQNIHFYGRVKSLGMTPKQIGHLLRYQALSLCIVAIPAGWILGFLINYVLSPVVIIGMGEYHPAFFFFSIWPFAVSAAITWLTTLIACWLPAHFVKKMHPAEALRYADIKGMRQEAKRSGKPHRTRILRMAYASMKRNKGRTLLAALSLFIATAMLCNIWTQYISYDEAKYMDGMAASDYLLADGSAAVYYQRYNPNSHSLNDEIVEKIVQNPAVTKAGKIQTMEVPMHASKAERSNIIKEYEAKDASGVSRIESMADNPQWIKGYETFKETGNYTGIITGIDGLALEILLNAPSNDGEFDADQFATGNYVIAASAYATDFISTPPVGSKITVGDREFEIMMTHPQHSTLITGSNSSQAAFSISYYVPSAVFRELYPDCGIRNVVIDIAPEQQTSFEKELNRLLANTNVAVTLRSDYQWNFRNALFHQQIIPLLIGCVLLLIGVLNFANALITKMLVRKKEFAIYESLGMTHKQLKCLLLSEGILYGGLLSILLLPSTTAVTWFWSHHWLQTTNTWCITYQYSILPLWIVLPLLIVLAIVIPLCCLRFITKESVTQRLRIID